MATPEEPLSKYWSHPSRVRARRVVDLTMPSPLDAAVSNREIDDAPPEVATAVLDLAMRFGELLVASGTPANDTVVLLLRLTRAFGLKTVYVDVSYMSITTSYYRGWDRPPVTTTRVVRTPEVDFTMVERAERLMDAIESTPMSIHEATERFRRIMRGPRPHPRWMMVVGTALTAAGAVLIWGGSWSQMLATFALGVLVYSLQHAFARLAVPPFFTQVAGAAVVAVCATGLWWLSAQVPWLPTGRNPDVLMTGGVIILVVGSKAVGAAQDAIDEFYLTAAARAVEVAMLTGGILVGLVLGIQLCRAVGVVPPLTNNFLAYGPLWAQLLGAFVVSSMYGLESNASWRTVALSGVAGLAGWAGFAAAHVGGLAEHGDQRVRRPDRGARGRAAGEAAPGSGRRGGLVRADPVRAGHDAGHLPEADVRLRAESGRPAAGAHHVRRRGGRRDRDRRRRHRRHDRRTPRGRAAAAPAEPAAAPAGAAGVAVATQDAASKVTLSRAGGPRID